MPPGSGEIEHGKASAFVWMRRREKERLVNMRVDAHGVRMPKRRHVPSPLMAVCLCHAERDDEAGEGQSAPVRSISVMALTGGATQCPPSTPPLLSFLFLPLGFCPLSCGHTKVL